MKAITRKRTPEHNRKIAQSLRGRQKSSAHRRLITEGLKRYYRSKQPPRRIVTWKTPDISTYQMSLSP